MVSDPPADRVPAVRREAGRQQEHARADHVAHHQRDRGDEAELARGRWQRGRRRRRWDRIGVRIHRQASPSQARGRGCRRGWWIGCIGGFTQCRVCALPRRSERCDRIQESRRRSAPAAVFSDGKRTLRQVGKFGLARLVLVPTCVADALLDHQELARGERKPAGERGELDRRAGAVAVGIEQQRAGG